MPQYRRVKINGSTFFFTVVLADRSSTLLVDEIDRLRQVYRQRRYWEHAIRGDADLERHVDYIHFNPVKHGHVARVVDWRHSSFHRYVERGPLEADWGRDMRDMP